MTSLHTNRAASFMSRLVTCLRTDSRLLVRAIAWRLVLPVLKRSMAGALILVFIPATRELSTAIFLYSINTQVLSVLLFDKSDEGNFESLAAIGLLLVVITVALILLGFRLMGRDFMLRRTVT